MIKARVGAFPIISNGNIITIDCVQRNLAQTGADGVMTAEGILDDPALFARPSAVAGDEAEAPPPAAAAAVPVPVPDKLTLAMEYLSLAEHHPVTVKTVVFHVRRMAKQQLLDYQLLDDCLRADSLGVVKAVVAKALAYQMHPASFSYDADKEEREKGALARKKHEEGKRKRYQ